MNKKIIYFLTIWLVALANTSVAADKKFEAVLVDAEKVIIPILHDFQKKGIRLAFGYEGITEWGSGFAVNNEYRTTDDIPQQSDKRQLFMSSYVAEISSATQGYCAGNFDTAKMYFVPPQNPDPSANEISNGQAYLLLNCGPFSKFNCSNKCKIDVWAGRWGASTKMFGSRLFFNKAGARQEIAKFKKELERNMLEATRYLDE